MSWLTPTSESILGSLPDSELDLYSAYDADGGDELPGIISRAVQMIRGKVAACPKAVMDPDVATIPPECEDALLAIVRHRLISRIDAEESDGEDGRIREYREAKDFLKEVANCKVKVTDGASVPTSGVSLVSSRKRHDRRSDLKGLL